MKFGMGILNRSNWANVIFPRVGSVNTTLEVRFLGIFCVFPDQFGKKLGTADLLIVLSSICKFRKNWTRECRTFHTVVNVRLWRVL